MSLKLLGLLFFCFVCVFAIGFVIYSMVKINEFEHKRDEAKKKHQENKEKGFVNCMNDSEFVHMVGDIFPKHNLEGIFNRAKNPWGMNYTTFQCIRFGGGGAFTIIGLPLFLFMPWQIPAIFCMIGFICWYYPMYYYKTIGEEREAEWNKMYEFVWVIKHNLMLYDPVKSYMNVKLYIMEHASHDKELIQGFEDFYNYWDDKEINPYIERYYPFSVPREITQIIFNMHKTGDFPEEQLNSLRKFIINAQDLTVEKYLSTVSSKATVFSLPFLMVTVIISLMVPLVSMIIQMM